MASKTKQEKAKKLLRDSTLPDIYKKVILKNVDKLKEQQLDKTVKALEKEQVRLGKTEKLLREFEKARKKAWQELAKKQQKIANEFVAATVKAMVESAKKQMLKELSQTVK